MAEPYLPFSESVQLKKSFVPIWNFRLVIGATWADISKAARVLGWRPQVTFEEGIARLVEWYQANRAWASDIEEYLKK